MSGRSSPRARAAALVTLVVSTASCAAGRAIVAPPDDYAAYRSTRTAPSLEERMLASQRYLAAFPDGSFAPEVRRWFGRAEEAFFASKRGSVAGLRAYLEVLPRGPHAALARREIDARVAASVDLLGRGARATEGRLAAAARERAAARDELGTWVRRFADPAIFGGPLAEAPRDLVVAWALALPEPRCEVATTPGAPHRRCTKVVERPYSLPGAGEVERSLLIEIAVDEDAAGAVCAVTIAGPSLFSRWEEASSLRPADGGAERSQAVLSATSMIRSSLETRGLTCAAQGEPGAAVRCGALSLVVRAGASPGVDDALTISRASPCSSP